MVLGVACLAGPGLAEGDENCRKFLDKTLPSSFEKVEYVHCVDIVMDRVWMFWMV